LSPSRSALAFSFDDCFHFEFSNVIFRTV
jgi:hypothetical protein